MGLYIGNNKVHTNIRRYPRSVSFEDGMIILKDTRKTTPISIDINLSSQSYPILYHSKSNILNPSLIWTAGAYNVSGNIEYSSNYNYSAAIKVKPNTCYSFQMNLNVTTEEEKQLYASASIYERVAIQPSILEDNTDANHIGLKLLFNGMEIKSGVNSVVFKTSYNTHILYLTIPRVATNLQLEESNIITPYANYITYDLSTNVPSGYDTISINLNGNRVYSDSTEVKSSITITGEPIIATAGINVFFIDPTVQATINYQNCIETIIQQ